jgi:hypothetical protein
MRRVTIVMTVSAAFMLLAGPAAASPLHHPGDGQHTTRAPNGAGETADGLAGKASFTPLGARLSGAATLVGTLYSSSGLTIGNAALEWAAEAGDGWHSDTGATAPDGSFSMSVVPTTNGWLYAYPSEDSTLAIAHDTWVAGSTHTKTLYPGRVSVSATRGGRWGDFSKISIRVWGATRYSFGAVKAADTSSTPVTGLVDVLDGDYSVGSAKFFWDEGVEFAGSFGVTSGSTAGTALSFDEAAAQRIRMTSPYWYSGKPGVTVKIACDNLPAGWIDHVTGYTDDPASTAPTTYGELTSSGAATESLSLKVPSAAKPGYGYWIGFQHVDASGNSYPLYLEEMYQVCTLKPSKTSIHRGARIRVRGVIPTAGHWGGQAGLKKVVTLYAHKGTAPVPTKWNPASKGWAKVGSVRATGSGIYTTPYFKPLKTLTLVARYPGDDWYYDAYTSTQKITVR